jgi:hypothetical protein
MLELKVKYRFRVSCGSVGNVNIETLDDLKTALAEIGYSEKAIVEIVKWYEADHAALS